MSKILNKKNIKFIDQSTMIYIGRPYQYSEEHFGNPFSHIHDSQASIIVKTRREAVANFEKWLRGEVFQDVEPQRRRWILDHLDLLRDKDLVCWCDSMLCHGYIYQKILKETQ